MYKIRCIDNQKTELINDCIATKKKVIISSLRPFDKMFKQIINLYCIPRYPVPFGEYNFDMIHLFDGFSNHCKNPLAVLYAVSRGAKYIEFHVTPTLTTFCIDNSVSFDMNETFEIMRWIRYFEDRNYNSG